MQQETKDIALLKLHWKVRLNSCDISATESSVNPWVQHVVFILSYLILSYLILSYLMWVIVAILTAFWVVAKRKPENFQACAGSEPMTSVVLERCSQRSWVRIRYLIPKLISFPGFLFGTFQVMFPTTTLDPCKFEVTTWWKEEMNSPFLCRFMLLFAFYKNFTNLVTLIIVIVIFSPTDNTGPEVVYCPPDQDITVSQMKTVVTWQSPEFKDNSNGPLNIECSHESGTAFFWGTWNVQCRAYDNNPSNDPALCQFTLRLKCEYL